MQEENGKGLLELKWSKVKQRFNVIESNGLSYFIGSTTSIKQFEKAVRNHCRLRVS